MNHNFQKIEILFKIVTNKITLVFKTKDVNISDRRGFTILFAVLMSSLLLSIGVSMFNILLKELLLASAGRESQTAFYAADTGIECAIYWDQLDDSFATSTTDVIDCNKDGSNNDNQWTVGGASKSEFVITFFPLKSCTIVSVEKSAGGDTTMIARGYNIGSSVSGGVNSCDSNDPRRVERTLRASY